MPGRLCLNGSTIKTVLKDILNRKLGYASSDITVKELMTKSISCRYPTSRFINKHLLYKKNKQK